MPAVLLASPTLVRATRGTVYIPNVNAGTWDVVLYPHTVRGTLSHAHLVSLPAGLEEREVSATVSSQTVTTSVQDEIASVDLAWLTEQEQR